MCRNQYWIQGMCYKLVLGPCILYLVPLSTYVVKLGPFRVLGSWYVLKGRYRILCQHRLIDVRPGVTNTCFRVWVARLRVTPTTHKFVWGISAYHPQFCMGYFYILWVISTYYGFLLPIISYFYLLLIISTF